jgi:hypothetical protein
VLVYGPQESETRSRSTLSGRQATNIRQIFRGSQAAPITDQVYRGLYYSYEFINFVHQLENDEPRISRLTSEVLKVPPN